MKHDLALVGIGIYSPADASRLIGVPATRLSRWLKGYQAGGKKFAPVWHPSIQPDSNGTYLSFEDLIQAKLVAAFSNAKLSPQKIRIAIRIASSILNTDHPFANASLRTDSKRIFLEIVRDNNDEPELIDLFSKGQFVMKTIVEPSFLNIEFESNVAARWWPNGQKAGVLVDPSRQFGRPIVAKSGVPVDILVRAVDAEGSLERAAKIFEVTKEEVKQALAFNKASA
jgi:uncharacterized protein (DUF433 family)